jgi:hypothetical protein
MAVIYRHGDKPQRIIIQITGVDHKLHALDNYGKVWRLSTFGGIWCRLPELPKEENN